MRVTVGGVEIVGIPVEIISPFLVAALGGAGFLIKRRWFSDTQTPAPEPPPTAPTAPRATVSAAANDYLGVVSTPQASSAPRQRAAANLTEAASAIEQDAPEAARIAYLLAAEPDRARAAALAAQLNEALDTHR